MPTFDDQFTRLYESDTLQLMHFTNGNNWLSQQLVVTIATLFKTNSLLFVNAIPLL